MSKCCLWLFRLLLSSVFFITPLQARSAPSAVAPDPEWEVLGEKEGIKVMRKQRPHSDLITFRGEGWIEAPLLRVASVLFDQDRAKEWVARLAETKILKWYSPTSYLEYDDQRS
jgi:hypothetical protein